MTEKKGITVRYTAEEYASLKKKSSIYGFQTLTSYIRYISLHEEVFKEDISGKKEICEFFDAMRQELIKEEGIIRDSIPSVVSTRSEKEYYEGILERAVNERKYIEQVLKEQLFVFEEKQEWQ